MRAMDALEKLAHEAPTRVQRYQGHSSGRFRARVVGDPPADRASAAVAAVDGRGAAPGSGDLAGFLPDAKIFSRAWALDKPGAIR